MDENPVFQGQNISPQPNVYGPAQAPEIPAAPPPLPASPTPSYAPPPPPQNLGGRSFSPLTLVKLFLGLFVVLILIVLLFAVVLPQLSKNKNEKVTLTYWGLWEDQRVMQPVIDDFEKQYPNITVEYSKQDIKQYRERLVTRISNGSGP